MEVSNKDNIVLYAVPGAYFPKISLLTFHEKGLKFKSHLVDIFTVEHYEPWFLKLNPKGLVPHGEKVTSGSDQISLYLDDTFFLYDIPKLLPDKGKESLRKVVKFDGLFRTINNALLMFGSIEFPQLTTGVLVPEYEQKARQRLHRYLDELVKSVVDRYPEVSEFASERMAWDKDLESTYKNIENVKKEIDSVGMILDQVEHELSSHNGDLADWWLCCEQFTTADLLLVIILQRLDLLGLSSLLLDPTKRPYVIAYKARIQKRSSFQAYLLDLERLHKEFEQICNSRSLMCIK